MALGMVSPESLISSALVAIAENPMNVMNTSAPVEAISTKLPMLL